VIRASRRRVSDRQLRVLVPLTALVAGIAVWWLLVRIAAVPRVLLPSPAAIAGQLATHPELYLSHAAYTLRSVLVGAGAGIAGGVVLGIALGLSRALRRMLLPYLVAARVTPKIAVAPLLLVYLGTGDLTGLAFVALIAFFPATISTLAGVDRTPRLHLDLLRSVDAGRLATLRHVRLRHAIPDIAAGIKQSTALGFVGAIVAEWILGTPGLGSLLVVGAETVQPSVLLAALAVLFVLGLSLYGAVAALLTRIAWQAA